MRLLKKIWHSRNQLFDIRWDIPRYVPYVHFHLRFASVVESSNGAISIPIKFSVILLILEIPRTHVAYRRRSRRVEKEGSTGERRKIPVTPRAMPFRYRDFRSTDARDRPNFARSDETTVRGQFLQRPVLHHWLLVISLSMAKLPFDYPHRRQGTTRYKSSGGARVRDENHSYTCSGPAPARRRFNAAEEAPIDSLLARCHMQIRVWASIARHEERGTLCVMLLRKLIRYEKTEATRESDSQSRLNVSSRWIRVIRNCCAGILSESPALLNSDKW